MLTAYIGTLLDQRSLSMTQKPAYQVLLFSRWLDTDSDIVRGTYVQTPIDLTKWVERGSLNLDMDTDASSLQLTINVEGLTLGIFYNCIIQLREGDAFVDPSQWLTTFTGWRTGQPGATESLRPGKNSPDNGRGSRGNARTVNLTFVSRERQFTDFEITSDGVWLPNILPNPQLNHSIRNSYDDVGLIAKEICTDTDWGMGLKPDEVLIGPLPYRIEKQLQFVQIAAWEALQQLLEVLHYVPGVNGEGKIVVRDRSIKKLHVRSYSGIRLAGISQPDANYSQVNAVIVKGLAKDLTEVIKANQKLTSISGTFGFFDPHMEFKDTWGADKENSYRVKIGTVTDGNGNSVQSPKIRHFHTDGFITSVNDPEITEATEYGYKVEIENDTLLIIGLLAAVFAGYVGAQVAVTLLTPTSTPPPSQTVVHPGAVVAQIAGSLLLLGGIYVLQQISNFQFDIYGVPFETVYEEIRADAILAQFSQIAGSNPSREWERKDVEIKNYIFSTIADSAVPAAGTEPAVTNVGIRRYAREELAIRLAEQVMRNIEMVRDLLLEPADIIKDENTGFRYFVKSISREIQRGESPTTQTIEAFRVP